MKEKDRNEIYKDLARKDFVDNGDTVKGHRVTGSRISYCPKCDKFLPHKLLVTNDTLSYQKLGYVCSFCDNLLIEIKRLRGTGQVISKYVDPRYRA